jgi:pyruvate kinase
LAFFPASSESHIYSQVQSILQREDKNYLAAKLDNCTYDFNQRQMAEKSKILFGQKKDTTVLFIMVTFDASFADNYALIKNLLQNGINVARINCAHDNEPPGQE